MALNQFQKSDYNQGAMFRHLAFPHYNGANIPQPTGQQLDELVEYLNDVEAAINGIEINQFYKLKAGNPYGMRRGTVVARLA